ncbi:thiosulfate/3-mercaptopyruvate sulfurtransferase [Tenacibaculum sp. MAR_2009_124]|uniref:sulfurtransferase n=1 Tax=Tenacibaculum sp. MAR_2009_124 TaxID=1250059 RepID=UPI0008975A0B|nr:sulfurtransferase [Tenacibaculum sp. MAR_2009_124]SEB49203.1 thiosulfate/3-mercaptopyruvate sulfurtransferase [Tenacibaculum sp. MAR_2009_124]
MKLKVKSPLVVTSWLNHHLYAENLVVLNGTIKKVGGNIESNIEEKQIPNAIFFDIKKNFSDTSSEFPSTIPSAQQFQEEARKIGINQDSCIVVYDNLGIYSAARVWWLFKTFGFDNVAVLDGGFPAWQIDGFPVENEVSHSRVIGDFKSDYQANNIRFTNDVLDSIAHKKNYILDARSAGRFNATQPEPRIDLKGGHIPTSLSLPYTQLLVEGKMKTEEELEDIFRSKLKKEKPLVFTCGSGITACILALGANIVGITNVSVYDGSWTEWASTPNLPIEKK